MASLQEVANKAGVSISTVSRVINNFKNVNNGTRSRVQKAMESLGYHPSRVAQRLRFQKGHSKLFGLIIPDIQNPFYSNIVRGIEDMAYKHNYAVILCNSDENPEKEKFYLDVLRSESVDGIILPPIHENGKQVEELIEDGLPVVCVDRRLANHTIDTVVVNNREGGFKATDMLIQLGHKKIGFISGRLHFSSSRERRQGYEEALAAHNIPLNPDYVRQGDQKQPESGRVLTNELLNLADPPTAIFLSNNLMTLGAIEAIHQNNLTIPDDISLIGFDDMPWARAFHPSLTVVQQPAYEMGRCAAETLFKRIQDPDRDPVLVVLDSTLVVRQSCRALPNN